MKTILTLEKVLGTIFIVSFFIPLGGATLSGILVFVAGNLGTFLFAVVAVSLSLYLYHVSKKTGIVLDKNFKVRWFFYVVIAFVFGLFTFYFKV